MDQPTDKRDNPLDLVEEPISLENGEHKHIITHDDVNMAEESKNTSKTNEWKIINRKNKGNSKKWSITGSGSNNDIMATQRQIQLFVSRISPSTSIGDFTAMVKTEINEAVCEKLTSKYPEKYSSFRVSINATSFEKAKDPNMWPDGSVVSKFFQSRQFQKEKK